MATLVLKTWRMSDQPLDAEGTRVLIVGRNPGIVSWVLTVVGVDPSTTVKVSPDRVQFTTASLAGSNHRLLPLVSVCSTFFGYHKPWKQAISVLVLILALAISLGPILQETGNISSPSSVVLPGAAVAVGLALAYYLLNRTLTLGFVENSGVINAIQFRRSVIEGVDVNENEARRVCDHVQHLIELKLGTLSRAAA